MKKKKSKNNFDPKKIQVLSLLFLATSLVYLILGLCISAKYEHFPVAKTSIMATSFKKDLHLLREPASVKEILIGTQLDPEGEITNAKEVFSKNDSAIFVTAKVSFPVIDEKVFCSFFYLGSEDLSKPILAGSESNNLNGNSKTEETITCKLASPGRQWQLEGDFKVVVSIPSSEEKMEKTFSIR